MLAICIALIGLIPRRTAFLTMREICFPRCFGCLSSVTNIHFLVLYFLKQELKVLNLLPLLPHVSSNTYRGEAFSIASSGVVHS